MRHRQACKKDICEGWTGRPDRWLSIACAGIGAVCLGIWLVHHSIFHPFCLHGLLGTRHGFGPAYGARGYLNFYDLDSGGKQRSVVGILLA